MPISPEVVYKIRAGERGLLTAPFFDGETSPFTSQVLTREGKVREGKPYREAKARDSAERIRKYLLEQGYFQGFGRADRGRAHGGGPDPSRLPHRSGPAVPASGLRHQAHTRARRSSRRRRAAVRRGSAGVVGRGAPGGAPARRDHHAETRPRPRRGLRDHRRAVRGASARSTRSSGISISGNASVDEKSCARSGDPQEGAAGGREGRLVDSTLDADERDRGLLPDARLDRREGREARGPRGIQARLLDVGITIAEGPHARPTGASRAPST
jgi:hypothetical protein